MSGNVVRFKMDRVLKLKETESIAVPAMSDYLSVGNNTAENANSNTYVYQPNKSLHQVSNRSFFSRNALPTQADSDRISVLGWVDFDLGSS